MNNNDYPFIMAPGQQVSSKLMLEGGKMGKWKDLRESEFEKEQIVMPRQLGQKKVHVGNYNITVNKSSRKKKRHLEENN